MAKRFTLNNPDKEKRQFQRRAIISVIIVLALVAAVIFRLEYLQIQQHARYTNLSQKNQQTVLPLAPTRGLIYDRNGVLLASNTPVFSLELIPHRVEDLKKTIAELQTMITISDEDIEAFHKQLNQRHRYDAIPLKIKLNQEEVARFYVNQSRFPGVVIRAQLIRTYPYADAMVDVLGFVGRINERDLMHVNMTNYGATNYIGKVGIEKFYEDELHGITGYEWVETDAGGRTMRVLQNEPPIAGKDMYLTIDSGLQLEAKKALGNEQGAIVAIQPQTGEVLAMVSNPTYDPNLFVNGMPSTIYTQLRNDPSQPLFNRAIRGQYPLASTIKPFLALGGLITKTTTPEFRIKDPGYVKLYNHTYRDWRKGGHGIVNLNRAIVISCDTYFYLLAMRMGITRMGTILRQFGFGEDTGLDIGEELPGLIPSPKWKKRKMGQSWYLGDTLISGIGQGYMLTTPIQLAVATTGLANRGARYQPHLLKKTISAKGTQTSTKPTTLSPVVASKKNWGEIIRGMHGVMTHGTGRKFGFPKQYTVAGKTGTGQVFSTHGVKVDTKNLPKHLRDHSMFIAFAPVDNPKIAIAVVVEHSPGTATKIARDVIDYWLIREKHL